MLWCVQRVGHSETKQLFSTNTVLNHFHPKYCYYNQTFHVLLYHYTMISKRLPQCYVVPVMFHSVVCLWQLTLQGCSLVKSP